MSVSIHERSKELLREASASAYYWLSNAGGGIKREFNGYNLAQLASQLGYREFESVPVGPPMIHQRAYEPFHHDYDMRSHIEGVVSMVAEAPRFSVEDRTVLLGEIIRIVSPSKFKDTFDPSISEAQHKLISRTDAKLTTLIALADAHARETVRGDGSEHARELEKLRNAALREFYPAHKVLSASAIALGGVYAGAKLLGRR